MEWIQSRNAIGAPQNPVLRWQNRRAGISASAFWKEKILMLYWALVFLLIAIVAGVLGFGGVAFAAAGLAKILFFVFLIIFLASLVMHLSRRGV
jgi:uncharacterized membrane protein YtjA (UPF0391 family)